MVIFRSTFLAATVKTDSLKVGGPYLILGLFETPNPFFGYTKKSLVHFSIPILVVQNTNSVAAIRNIVEDYLFIGSCDFFNDFSKGIFMVVGETMFRGKKRNTKLAVGISQAFYRYR